MKILLVDDSKSARYALRLQLQRHGVEVETADSAESAFEVLKVELPDAILMDHMMPGLNGFEALELIRADARTAHIPVVMCTSHEDADFAAAAQRKGVIGILPKSVAPEKLPDILNRLRDALAAASPAAARDVRTEPPAQAPVPTPVQAPVEAVPTPAGLSTTEVLKLVDGRIDRFAEERVDSRVDERVESRLAGLLAPVLEDLRRDLGERLLAEARAWLETRLAEARQQIEVKLADERIARDSARAAKDLQELEGVAARFVEQALPAIVKVEIEAERAEILGLVEQYVRELGPQGQPGADLSPERLAALEGVIAGKAENASQRAAQEAIETGIDRINRIADAMTGQVQAGMRQVYFAIGGAALVGALSAALVYFVLS